jgi:hypothetical protein
MLTFVNIAQELVLFNGMMFLFYPVKVQTWTLSKINEQRLSLLERKVL